jgi:hypothetical protein
MPSRSEEELMIRRSSDGIGPGALLCALALALVIAPTLMAAGAGEPASLGAEPLPADPCAALGGAVDTPRTLLVNPVLPYPPLRSPELLGYRLEALGAEGGSTKAFLAALGNLRASGEIICAEDIHGLIEAHGLAGLPPRKTFMLAAAFLKSKPVSLVGIEISYETRSLMERMVQMEIDPDAAARISLSAERLGWPAEQEAREALCPVMNEVVLDPTKRLKVLSLFASAPGGDTPPPDEGR